MSQKKEDIYVILCQGRALHAVKTKRQAELFIKNWESELSDLGLIANSLSAQEMSYQKIKLIHPRELSKKQLENVKGIFHNEKTSTTTQP